MNPGIDADGFKRVEVEILNVGRRWLQDHLKLVVMLKTIGIFAIAPVLRPAGRLHIGRVPWPRPQRAQRRCRMKRAGAHFHVVGLQDDATMIRPVALQSQYQSLERALGAHVGGKLVVHLLAERGL